MDSWVRSDTSATNSKRWGPFRDLRCFLQSRSSALALRRSRSATRVSSVHRGVTADSEVEAGTRSAAGVAGVAEMVVALDIFFDFW